MSDIVFNWDKMLNLKGASAPYVQYSYARLRSVLRKTKNKSLSVKIDPALIKEKQEQALSRHLAHFTEILEDAAARYEPSRLAEYLLKLAEKINHFYESAPILSAEPETKKNRLALVEAAAIIIKSGMNLLGIEVPERM